MAELKVYNQLYAVYLCVCVCVNQSDTNNNC